MSAVCEVTPRPSRGSTQPLDWDWVTDWTDLESAADHAESRVRWNWQRELAELHRALDTLESRLPLRR